MKKTILITGSTDGIGKLAAILLAKDGHTVYIHGRTQEKIDDAVKVIKEESENQNISGFVANFSDLDTVRSMSAEIIGTLPSLDVLINNAGIYKSSESTNKDGLDMRIVVNYLSPYVLTQSLLPLLDQAPKARIINLSSAAQLPVSLEVLLGTDTQPDNVTYAQSKLALTMWSFRLAEEHPNLSVIALNPGSLLNTNMVKEAFGQHWSSADKGAEIEYSLAVSSEYDNVTAEYFDNDKGDFGKAHADAYVVEKIESLLKATEEIVASP